MSGKPAMTGSRLALLIASAMLAAFAARESSAADAPVVTKLTVAGTFTAPNTVKKPKKKKARGISGMACLGTAADANRECLVINDEERFGEIATLTKDVLAIDPGAPKTIPFVKDDDSGDDVLGKKRVPQCDKEDEFDELDGEGVAIDGDLVYVASSHSCSGDGEYKPSSYLLVRFKAKNASSFKGAKSPTVEPKSPTVERSWRLADVLLGSDIKNVSDGYGKPKGVGTNIEGIAVIDGRLYAGLRTPTGSSVAYIVSAPVKELFESGSGSLDAKLVKSFEVELGANTGIRDLAALPSGRLLILAGPSGDQDDVEYKLWLLEKPVAGAAKKLLATVTTSTPGKDGKLAKAETVTVEEETANALKVLVMYDNIDEGEPTRYEIKLQP